MNQSQNIAHYRIIKQLGSGGFGDTFLVEDTYLPSGKNCVLKQLKPINNNPQIYQLVKDRFQREAIILENLGNSHDQIPTLKAYFEENGKFYLVQEYIEGETLASLVQSEGKQSESTVKSILIESLEILEFIQGKNIIHRDIKPDNIIIRKSDNKPVLIDFGAVRETMATVMTSSGNSTSSIIIGTPGFMPSEQGIGRPVFASDLYALGLTAIYLLTGKTPQDLTTDPLTGEIIWQNEVSNISPTLANVLNRAIKSHFQDRFATAKDMKIALIGQTILPTQRVIPNNYAPTEFSPPPPKPVNFLGSKAAIALSIFLLLLGGGSVAFYLQNQQESEPVTIELDPENPIENNDQQQREKEAEQRELEQLEAQQRENYHQGSNPTIIRTGMPSRGMWIVKVNYNSEAYLAGMTPGQILISLNGNYIDQVETANWIVSQNVGQPIRALVWENGEQKTLNVTPIDNYIGVTLCKLSSCPNGIEP